MLFGPFARLYRGPLPLDDSGGDYYASSLGDAKSYDGGPFAGAPAQPAPPPMPALIAAQSPSTGAAPATPAPAAPAVFPLTGRQTTRRTQLFGPLALLQPPGLG